MRPVALRRSAKIRKQPSCGRDVREGVQHRQPMQPLEALAQAGINHWRTGMMGMATAAIAATKTVGWAIVPPPCP